MFRFKPSLIFEITDKCNLRCSFCYERVRRSARHIHPHAFRRVLKSYRPLYLQITGGEALLHPEFEELLTHATRMVPIVQITTNGTVLDTKIDFLRDLKKKPVIAISLDFADERHDRVRKRKGLFKRIEGLLPVMKREGIPVALSSTIFGPGVVQEAGEGNLGDVVSLIEFSAHHDIPINIQSCSPAQKEVRVELGTTLLASTYTRLVDSRAYQELLIRGHNGRCRFNVLNTSIGADGIPLPTEYGNCYFCQDCMKCYYSCVWEPTLLLSRHLPAMAAHFLRMEINMTPTLRRLLTKMVGGP